MRKGNKCVRIKSTGMFRVAYEVPSNFGFEKTNIKVFTSLPKAKTEFNKRFAKFKRDVKTDDFEGGEGIILEDIKKDLRIKSRIVDEDGEIQNNDGMR